MSPFTTKPISSEKKNNTLSITQSLATGSSPYKVFMGVFLTTLAIIFIGNLVYGYLYPDVKNNTTRPNFVSSVGSQISTLFGGVSETKPVTYILLTGKGGEGHEGADLTDTIMVAALDNKNKTMSMLSIPRDLYVAVGTKESSKINELYTIGKSKGLGDSLLREKIKEITGITIDYSIMIDFSGFREVVDILGGVEVDVPEDLIDREFPDDNWGYRTLTIRKGLQVFDGKTALDYARSRHSTSDFSRSARQQLLIKAIKEKVLSSGIYNPSQIVDIFESLKGNLETDIPITTIIALAMQAKEVPSTGIQIMNLNNNCLSINVCEIGAFLYNPSRDLFGGASVLIPENATMSKLSYYEDTRRLAFLFFGFPKLREQNTSIDIITGPKNKISGQNTLIALKKLGFPVKKESLVSSTGTIENSHINIYWNKEHSIGYSPNSEIVLALKSIFPTMTFIEVTRNEYNTNNGPRIEIVLGNDSLKYTVFAERPYYIPAPPPKASAETGESLSDMILTPRKKNGSNTTTRTGITTIDRNKNIDTISPVEPSTNTTPETSDIPADGVKVGEWEDFSNTTTTP